MFLQLPAQSDLRAILSVSAVVSQNEVGMAVVKHRKFAERVGHGLVRSRHLVKAKHRHSGDTSTKNLAEEEEPNLKHSLMLIKHECMHSCAMTRMAYVSSDQILFIFHNTPWCNSDGAHLPTGLGGVIFQRISHMPNHSCAM